MQWMNSKLNTDIDIFAPAEEKYQAKYIVGTRLLVLYKSYLLKSEDKSFQQFLDIYEHIFDATLLDFDRAFLLYQLSRSTKQLGGASAECGVYKGGGSALIASVDSSRRHYAFDTFAGFPDIHTDHDVHDRESFRKVSFETVTNLFMEHPNIIIRKGTFHEQFGCIDEDNFSFVHVDADLYQSVLECCEFFYPRLLPSGVMLFDDYLFSSTPGAKKAIDSFFEDKPETPVALPTFQAMVTKSG